jgi:hypothetical protein
MSWSATLLGTRASILEAMPDTAAKQRALDETWALLQPGIIEGHAAQLSIVAAAVAALQMPDNTEISVSCNGHANADGSGYVGITINHPAGIALPEGQTSWVQPSLSPEGLTNSEGDEGGTL